MGFGNGQLLKFCRPTPGGGGTSGLSHRDAHDRSLQTVSEMGQELQEDMEHMQHVMMDLEAVLNGMCPKPETLNPQI